MEEEHGEEKENEEEVGYKGKESAEGKVGREGGRREWEGERGCRTVVAGDRMEGRRGGSMERRREGRMAGGEVWVRGAEGARVGRVLGEVRQQARTTLWPDTALFRWAEAEAIQIKGAFRGEDPRQYRERKQRGVQQRSAAEEIGRAHV